MDAGSAMNDDERTVIESYRAGGSRVVNLDQVKPKLPRNADGLAKALAMLDIGMRYDLRASRPQYRVNGGTWQDSTDRLDSHVRERISASFLTGDNKSLWFGRDTWNTSQNSLLFENEVDPFLIWLDALPEWDEQERLDVWLTDVFKADEGCELTQWASAFIPLGAVCRTYDPGTKLDEIPILIGPQGCGKSTALRCLLPPKPHDWFADGLHLASPPKERVEALRGRVIVEAAEMAGSTRADLQTLKAFLSRTDDGSVRMAYKRHTETMLRRCVIIGTANPGECLPNDPTGNRRFVPIEVGPSESGAAGVREYLDANREQIWAEAVYEYVELGAVAYLPDRLKGFQNTATEQFRKRDDILEDRLAAWLATEHRPDPFRLEDAAAAVWPSKSHAMTATESASHLSMADLKRLGAALNLLGISKRQTTVAGKRGNFWSKW